MNHQHPSAIYLRTSDVAAILHVSPKTISRWVKAGKLPCSRTLGGQARFNPDDIRKLARSLAQEPSGGDAP